MEKIIDLLYTDEAFLTGFGMAMGFILSMVIGACSGDDQLLIFGFKAAMTMMVMVFPYLIYGALHNK